MAVSKYSVNGKTYWKIATWLSLPDGRKINFRKRKIPTREMAQALEAQKLAEAFEGRYFPDRQAQDEESPTLTVKEAWELYRPVSERDNDSSATDAGRAKHLLRHLGEKDASALSREDVEGYRTLRLAENTVRGKPPSPATLDREVELLQRFLNFAVDCRKLTANPISRVELLRKPNVRRVVADEETFQRILAAAGNIRPILLVLFDSGMRLREVLDLKWKDPTDAYGLDLAAGCIRLHPDDTKSEDDRNIYLTARTIQELKAMPRRLGCPFAFPNPKTGEPYQDIRKAWRRAVKAAGLKPGQEGGITLHDLRRSFITKARRAGVPESVVMRMSGHRTRAVFDRYNITDDSDVKAAVAVLDSTLAPQNTTQNVEHVLNKRN